MARGFILFYFIISLRPVAASPAAGGNRLAQQGPNDGAVSMRPKLFRERTRLGQVKGGLKRGQHGHEQMTMNMKGEMFH